MDDDSAYMRLALDEAAKAAERGEVPVGAVIVEVSSGTVLAAAGNGRDRGRRTGGIRHSPA